MTAANVAAPGVTESLLSRVRKLLVQAEDSGATAAEAEAFNAKAAQLIARYGIDAALLASSGHTREEIGHRTVVVDNPYRRDKAHLLTSVAEPLRCQTVHSYDSDRYVVRLYGFGADLERVELLYTSLLLQATRQLVHVRPGGGWYGEYESTAAYRRSWLAGFTTAVYTRLLAAEEGAVAEQPATSDGTSTALVLRDRGEQVDTAVRVAHPGLRTMRQRNLSGSGRKRWLRGGHPCGHRRPPGRRHPDRTSPVICW